MATLRKLPKSNQFRALFYKNATFLKRQKCSLCVQITIPAILVIILVIVNLWIKSQMNSNDSDNGHIYAPYVIYNNSGYQNGFFYTVDNGIEGIGYKDQFGKGSGFLDELSQISRGNGSTFTPYLIPISSDSAMNDAVFKFKENSSIGSSGSSWYVNQFPMAGITFNKFSPTNNTIDYVVSCDTQYYGYRDYDDSLIYTLNNLASMFINYFLKDTGVQIQSSLTSMPYYSENSNLDIASIIGGSFYPFALSFILPLYIYTIVYEKQEKLRDLSLMMGLKIRNYWLMTYIFNILIYTIIIIFVVGISVIFQFAVFAKGSHFAMFLLLFGWGNAMITFAFFLSTFFKKTRAASIFGYFLLIICVNVNSVLSTQVFNNSSPPLPYYWVPLLAFYRGMFLLSTECGYDLCPNWADYTWSYEVSRIIFWLYIDAIVFLILSLYLDQVLPREFGVPSHPLFFLKEIKNLFIKESSVDNGENKINGYSEKTSLINSHKLNNSIVDIEDEEMDSDVKEEKDIVLNHKYNPDEMTVIIEGLSKHYPGRPKPALSELYLTIKKGEVLGLLGPNGAGKTTTISMLTGLYTPTSGTAYVSGLDIRYDMNHIHRIIGVAMQFDIFWEDLSCIETLLYYSRLKGVSKENEFQSVETVLKEVGLYEVRERLVKELSGGMKRRLSFAVAMTGDSSIIFLDEPSTGLDPETRLQLWETINGLKKNRSIVLTSHHMKEVDTLSDRVAIISQGKLQCIGTQQHLKKKFGDGYLMTVNIEEPYINTHNPTELITRFSPQAQLSGSFNGNYSYRLPKDTVVSDLYQYLISNKSHYHISTFSFSQTSLEDVFLKISEGDQTVN